MKRTKRKLLISMVCMLLTLTTLLGSTYAWFTDSVSNTGNRIQAGNLSIDLLMDKTLDDGNPDDYVSIKDGIGDIFLEADNAKNSSYTLWEPGKTQIVYLAVENKGTLAAKYNVYIDVSDFGLCDDGNGNSSLEYALFDEAIYADYLEMQTQGIDTWNELKALATVTGTVVDGRQTISTGVLDEIAHDPSIANERDYVALAVHMKETAGNEYQDKYCIIDVTISATQLASENDGFGTNIYDDDLDPTVTDYIKHDSITKTIDSTVNTVFVSDYTIQGADGLKTTITIPKETDGFEDGSSSTLEVEATALLAANQNATFNIVDAQGSVGAIDLTVKVNGEEVTEFKDGDTPVAVTVVTYIAKGLTLNNVEDTIAIKYVGTGKSDPTLVSYETDTGRLEFTTTHFSTFAIGADQTAYIERNNTAYMTLKEAVNASEENDEIIMIKDSTIGVKKKVVDTEVDDGKAIDISKNLSIDLNGKTIYSSISKDRGMHLHDCSITIYGNVGNIKNPGSLIVEDSTSYGLINAYSNEKDTTLTINNLIMSGDTDNGALINAVDGSSTSNVITLNIDGCKVNNTNNRFQDCGTDGLPIKSKFVLNVNGGTFNTGKRTFAIDSLNAESKATFISSTATSTEGPVIEVARTKAEFTSCNFVTTDGDDFYRTTIGTSNGGETTIKSGSYTSDSGNALEIYSTGGTLNISGGTFEGDNDSIKTYDGCTNNVNINGGIFNGHLDLAGSDTHTNITSGEFYSNKTVKTNGGKNYINCDGCVNISGGTFNNCQFIINNSTNDSGYIAITKDKYDELASCISDDYSVAENDEIYTVHKHSYTLYEPNSDGKTHKIKCVVCGQVSIESENCDTEGTDGTCSKCGGWKTITSLAEFNTVLSKIEDNKYAYIKLASNIYFSSDSIVISNKNVVFDLNGHQIVNNNNSGGAIFNVTNAKLFIIGNVGTSDSDLTHWSLNAYKPFVINDGATIDIKGTVNITKKANKFKICSNAFYISSASNWKITSDQELSDFNIQIFENVENNRYIYTPATN